MMPSPREMKLIDTLAKGGVADVPCNGCTACCKNEFKLLLPEQGDDVASYEHVYVDLPKFGRRPMLANKPNGECVYLTDAGCSIHARAPRICRAFDCRGFYQMHTRAERRRMVRSGQASADVLEAGRVRSC